MAPGPATPNRPGTAGAVRSWPRSASRRGPLSAALIDARIEHGTPLDDRVSTYLAMCNIADLVPDGTGRQIRRLTAGREP